MAAVKPRPYQDSENRDTMKFLQPEVVQGVHLVATDVLDILGLRDPCNSLDDRKRKFIRKASL